MKRMKCRTFLSQRILEIAKEMADECTTTTVTNTFGCHRGVLYEMNECCWVTVLCAPDRLFLDNVLWLQKTESRNSKRKTIFHILSLPSLYSQLNRTHASHAIFNRSVHTVLPLALCVHFVLEQDWCTSVLLILSLFLAYSCCYSTYHVSLTSYSLKCE